MINITSETRWCALHFNELTVAFNNAWAWNLIIHRLSIYTPVPLHTATDWMVCQIILGDSSLPWYQNCASQSDWLWAAAWAEKIYLDIFCKDAPVAISLVESNFWIFYLFFCKCDQLIKIFTDSDFLSKNYKWQHMSILFSMQKLLNITIPPIWTKLQMISLNSQNKVLCDCKEVEMSCCI